MKESWIKISINSYYGTYNSGKSTFDMKPLWVKYRSGKRKSKIKNIWKIDGML